MDWGSVQRGHDEFEKGVDDGNGTVFAKARFSQKNKNGVFSYSTKPITITVAVNE